MAQGTVVAEMVVEGDKRFQAAMESAGDSIEDTGDEATGASVRLSRLGENLESTGDEATQTAAKMGGLRLSMLGMSGTASTLIPALTGVGAAITTLSVAMGPLIAGLAGVAAGFGAVFAVLGGGLLAGAATHTKELTKAWKSARKAIQKAIKPVGELFGPLLVNAVQALPELVRGVLDAVGSLKPFRDALQQLGTVGMRVIPEIAGAVADLARAALPLFMDVTTAIMNGVAPAIQFLQDAMTRLQTGVSTMLPALRLFWDGLQPLLGALAPLADEIQRFAQLVVIAGLRLGGKLLPLLAPLAEGLTTALGIVNNFVAALLGIGDATNPVVAALRRLIGRFDGFRTKIRAALTRVKQIAQRILGEITTFWNQHGDAIIQTIRSAYQFVRRTVTNALNTLLPIVRQVLGVIADEYFTHVQKVIGIFKTQFMGPDGILANARTALTSLWQNIIKPALNTIQAAWDRWGQDILNLIRTAMQTIGTVVRTALRAVLATINVILDLISGDWDSAWTTIKNSLQTIWNTLVSWVKTTGKTLLTTAIGVVITAAKEAWKYLTGADENSLYGDVTGILSDLWNWVKTTGKDLAKTAINTVVTAATKAFKWLTGDGENSLYGTATSAVTDLWNWVKTTGKEKAVAAVDLVITKITDAFNWLISTATGEGTLYGMATGALNDLITWVKETASSLFSGAFGAVIDAIKSAVGWLTGDNSLKGEVIGRMSELENWVSNVWGIVGAFTGVLNDIKGIVDSIIGQVEEANQAVADARGMEDVGGAGLAKPPSAYSGDDGGGGGGGGGDTDVDRGDINSGGSTNIVSTPGGSAISEEDEAIFSGAGFAAGGLTQGEGLAYLHPNEAIMGVEAGAEAIADAMGAGGDTFQFDIDIEGDTMDERELARVVEQRFTRELRRLRTR